MKLLFERVINTNEFIDFLHAHDITVIYIYLINNKFARLSPESENFMLIGVYYISPFVTGFKEILDKVLNDEKLSENNVIALINRLFHKFDIYVSVGFRRNENLYEHLNAEYYLNLIKQKLLELISKIPELRNYEVNIVPILHLGKADEIIK